MNILDENVPESQRRRLKKMRVPVRQVGPDIGRKGMKDDEIIRLLHRMERPTFFTLDVDFYHRRLLHPGYCLVHLDVVEEVTGRYVRRLLKHPEFNTKMKRMGTVIRVAAKGLAVWRIHESQELFFPWR